MEVFDVVVEGFPSTMAQKKIELFIKGRFRKEFEVEKIGEGRVGIKICDAKDVHAFPHHSMREVLFGSQSYPLTYLKSPIEIPDTSEDLRMHIYHGEDLQQLPASSGSIWNDNPVGTTGSKNSAESAPENVNICTELKTVEVPIDEDEFRTLTLCGIIEDLKKNFWNASFEFSSVRNLLTVIAPDRDLPMIQKKIWKNSIRERRIADLNESVRRYLIETIAVNRAKIQAEILAKDIKAEFVPNASGVYIKSKCEEDHTKVADVIRRLTWVSNLDVSGPKAEVIEKEKWKEFVQKIAKENCAVYEKGCKSIDIVGLKDVDADVIREKFRLFFEEHVIRVATVPLNQCQAKFVLDYCERFNVNNPKRKALKHFSQLSKPGGTLRLEGTEKSIQEAQLEINQIVAGIVTEKHSRSNPAIKRYYMDPANQGAIENIRRATNCYIEAMSPSLTETKGTEKAKLEPKASNTAMNVPRTSLFSTQLGKLTMRICMVDIVSHTADGIVNIVTHGHSTSADEYNATVDKSRKRFQIEPARFNHSMEGAASVQKLMRSQNLYGTSMDDLDGILKESAQHLRLSQNFDETSLDHLKEISKTYTKFRCKPTVLDMICDVLLEEGILKTFVRLWDLCHVYPIRFYMNTENILFQNLEAMKDILWNFSDKCKSLAVACFKDSALIDRLMKDFTLPQLNVQKLARPSLSHMIEADLEILHNLVRHANQNRNHIRRNNGIDKIFAYKNAQSIHIKACVFIVLAYCINEDENSIIMSGTGVISILLKNLESALCTPAHVGSMTMSKYTSTFSAEEILAALSKLASNDGNKKAIIDAGILPIVTKLLDSDTSSATENLEAVHLIWLLAVNKQEIIQESGLLTRVLKAGHPVGALFLIQKGRESFMSWFDHNPVDSPLLQSMLRGHSREIWAIRASAQQLRLSQNFEETSLDHLKKIRRSFSMLRNKRLVSGMICAILLKEDILKTFVRLWDLCHENPNAFYRNTEHVLFKNLDTMKSIFWNLSDKCKCLAAACFTDGALIDRLMMDFTLPQLNVRRLVQPNLSRMIEADLSILHNLVRHDIRNRYHIRRNNGIEKIFTYEKSQSLHVKACVFIVLAYCVNEEENSIIASGAKVIPFILKILKSAVSTVTHVGNMSMSTSRSSFSVEEILAALNKLASNDGNKKAIVDAGILPIVTKLLDPDTSSATENLKAVNLIWLLAVHSDNKQNIIQEPGLLEWVRKLRVLKGVSDRMTKAVGSLMIALKLEQVTSESHLKEDTGKANQTKEEMEPVNQNKRNLLPTEAVITSAENLPNCQKIINVVGPELEGTSDIEQKRLMASCINNILKVAEEAKLTSIAIPAMGWGGSRINPNAVTPHIVNAVSQYFQPHPESCITRVDFVEFKNQEVLDEFQKVLRQIEIRPTVTARPTTVVQIGDIAKQNADAVVNIMAKYQIVDMTKGSVIAKVLAAAAGEDVVKECAQNSGKYNDGDIFVTRAGSLHCKNIIHGIVSTYDRNSEEIVKKIVQKSLQHASQANYRSIVFPAIGTGGFNMPPNEVAMWMKKAINNYGPKSTHVKIVLHVSNPKALHAFQAEFNQTNMITSSYANYGSLNVCITDGDILQRNEDVIVNSADMTFDLMRAGPLSAAILREGGSEIQNELKNSSGDMAVTSGGKLPCKHIIHLVSRTEDRQLRKTIVKVLMKADSLKAASIAFPALGTGNINKPAKDAASLLHSALQEFIESNPTPQNLKRMTVVVYNKTLIQDYITIMVGYRVMRKTLKAKARGFAEFCSSVFEKNTAHQAVDFHFYASDKKDIVKALECIDEKTTEILCKEQIEDSALDTVTDLEMLEFQEKAEEKNVSIQRLSINSTGLLVTGLENDVKVFSDYSRKILRELVVAQTCVEFVTWETEIEQKWYEFPPRPAHLLEKAYQKNKHHPGPVQIKVVENGQIVSKSYDLSTLDKKNSTIRRRQTENYELPAGWDPMQGLHVRRIVLNDTSEEYKRVLNVCKKKGLPVQTAMIERIQNISLYKKYAAEKAEVTEKLEDENVRIERELFHGTGKADKIVKRGFNRSFAGENGARFGNGVYFSTSAKYSHDFTNRGARTIFLANVITGTYTQGSPGMKTAPDRSDNDLHDSVVDDVNNPTMFVVFKDASAYPTYLIEYT